VGAVPLAQILHEPVELVEIVRIPVVGNETHEWLIGAVVVGALR
jgi:hypothetical protein